MFKKIISFILIIAIVCSLFCMPVAAADLDQALGLWDFLQRNSGGVGFVDFLGSFLSRSDDGCPVSSNGLHRWHCTDITIGLLTNTFVIECEHCHENYREYLGLDGDLFSNEDIPQIYETSTQQLPAQTITSTGEFYVYGTHNYSKAYLGVGSNTITYYCSHHDGSDTIDTNRAIIYFNHLPQSVNLLLLPPSGSSQLSYQSCTSYWTVSCPVTGYYTLVSSLSSTFRYGDSSLSGEKNWTAADRVHYSSGASISKSSSVAKADLDGNISQSQVSLTFYPPKYFVTPDSALNISTGDTYNIDNRVSNYVTQYLVDNSVNTTQIINETNNTYYSPITNETYDMSGWTYDYSTRTYNITIDGSDGATVTFGDNAIQIVEGNVTNNYYYYITPSDDPDDPGGDSSGLLAWLQEVWPNLMEKLDNILNAIGGDGGSGSGSDHWWQDSDNPDDPDDPDADDDLGILQLFKTVLRGLINILNGFLSLIFDGIENLIEWIGSIGDFFDYFSPNSDVNIWTVEEGST